MRSEKSKFGQSGVTLLELLMVITITGILAAVGTSSFKYVNNANRISSEINGLLGDLQFARSEAIKEGLPVTVCPTANFSTCGGTSTWSTGWLVFVDLNTIGTVDASDQILRKGRLNSGSTDTLTGSAATLTYISFNREGFATNPTGNVWALLNLQSNPANPKWKRCIAVSNVGAITTEKGGASVPTTC